MTSTFVIVHHTMKVEKGAGWWKNLEENYEALQKDMGAKNEELGLYNHCFMPVTSEIIYCLWEVKEGVSMTVLQEHLDAYVGGGAMNNHVMPVMAQANVPPRHFA